MKYKPIYSYDLDHTFYKRIGRNSNPKRFGLTKLQVQELQKAGQWEQFLEKWYKKRSAFMYHNRLYCIVCGGLSRKVIVILNQRICRKCCEEIRERVKEN
jgi:predicted translin family RNA/ssDNA-binding protein